MEVANPNDGPSSPFCQARGSHQPTSSQRQGLDSTRPPSYQQQQQQQPNECRGSVSRDGQDPQPQVHNSADGAAGDG
eukprot:1148208-Pelagomonas_calceolata.AAC.4